MITRLLFRNKSYFSVTYLKKLEQLFNRKQYEQILQIKNLYNPSINQIKQRYYKLVKQYHSDNCQDDPQKAKVYEQITKIIIKSYNQIDKRFYQTRKDIFQDTYIEDEICMELFGKKFAESKYWMYEKGNQKAKDMFFKKLFQRTGKKSRATDRQSYYDFSQKSSTYQKPQTPYKSSSVSSQQASSSNTYGAQILLVGIAALAGLYLFKSSKSSQSSQKKQTKPPTAQKYSAENVYKIIQNKCQIKQQKADIIINSIVKDHPPCLEFPSQGPQPHIMKQLVQYSIAPDINLYEVRSFQYQEQKKAKIVKQGLKLGLFHLTRIKPNTAMTLSLEAQRALQNIYVKVKDLINEIQTTGTYKPPQIFLRFHGYVMFEIRQKPISLRNYRDTEYVSLFDLYFDYYSPIFFKKDNFSQYLVGKDEPQYFGWVNLNNKKCNPVYLNAGDKAAFFYSERRQQSGISYQQIWKDFYRNYQDRWREGCNTKKRCGI